MLDPQVQCNYSTAVLQIEMAPLHIALVHYPVTDRRGKSIAASITSFDLHDISRSCRTYNLVGYWLVNPLDSQHALAQRIIDYWGDGPGRKWNPQRAEALSLLKVTRTLAETVAAITELEGQPPLVIGTDAHPGASRKSYAEGRQSLLDTQRPHLLVFGTANGLAEEVLDGCDWILDPIRGAGDYNHLSVRSAVAIILDRLIGETV